MNVITLNTPWDQLHQYAIPWLCCEHTHKHSTSTGHTCRVRNGTLKKVCRYLSPKPFIREDSVNLTSAAPSPLLSRKKSKSSKIYFWKNVYLQHLGEHCLKEFEDKMMNVWFNPIFGCRHPIRFSWWKEGDCTVNVQRIRLTCILFSFI